MKTPLLWAAVVGSTLIFSIGTYAAECTIDKKPADLSLDEINTHYECVREQLVDGYQKGDNEFAKAYTDWKAGATGPAKPGFHSNRYLMTYVNDIGHADYVAYATSDVDLPVGSVLAKESYKIRSKGKIKAGPLFFMEKVGKDKAPAAGGWFYSAVKANGKPMKVSQKFCHNCHQGWAAQDALGYPAPDVRIK